MINIAEVDRLDDASQSLLYKKRYIIYTKSVLAIIERHDELLVMIGIET